MIIRSFIAWASGPAEVSANNSPNHVLQVLWHEQRRRLYTHYRITNGR